MDIISFVALLIGHICFVEYPRHFQVLLSDHHQETGRVALPGNQGPFLSSTSNVLSVTVLCSILFPFVQEAEKHLSEMVVSKALMAKIDRPMGVVCFQIAKDSNEILNSWAVNLEKLLDLVEKSCHQIHKETMVHKAALKV